MSDKKIIVFGFNSDGIKFDDVTDLKDNVRDFSLTGTYNGVSVTVISQKKPTSGVFILDITGESGVGQAPVPPSGQPVGQAPVPPSGQPVGQADATDITILRSKLFQLGMDLHNKGYPIVAKLASLGYPKMTDVPDDQVASVFAIFENPATWS